MRRFPLAFRRADVRPVSREPYLLETRHEICQVCAGLDDPECCVKAALPHPARARGRGPLGHGARPAGTGWADASTNPDGGRSWHEHDVDRREPSSMPSRQPVLQCASTSQPVRCYVKSLSNGRGLSRALRLACLSERSASQFGSVCVGGEKIPARTAKQRLDIDRKAGIDNCGRFLERTEHVRMDSGGRL